MNIGNFKKLGLITFVVITTLGLSISLQGILAAWTGPTAVAPGNNVFPPVYNETLLDNSVYALIDRSSSVNGNLTVSGAGYYGGSVGIGVVAPTAALHIDRPLATSDNIKLGGSGNTVTSAINFITDEVDGAWVFSPGTTYPAWALDNSLNFYNEDGPIAFQTAGQNNRMVINSAGNVGIGTESPSARLDVNGPSLLRSTYLTNNSQLVSRKTDNSMGLRSFVWTDDNAYMDYGQNNLYIRAYNGSTYINTLILDESGNVGVGAVPSTKLDVNGNVRIRGGSPVAGKVLTASDANGNATWQTPGSVSEVDGIIGNEVTNTANTTLLRSGAGTAASPYLLALNLGNANTWTAAQTFNANTNFPGSGVWNTSGNVGIGIAAPTQKLHVNGTVLAASFLYSSDERLKTDIQPLENSLGILDKINGVRFNWKDGGAGDIGLIAQEVEKVLPECVSTGSDGYKSVDYANIVPVLVEAIKDQQAQIDELKAQLENLK